MKKNIMFGGTASSVGKSLLTAAFCRIINDEGYKVMPFKSQNMALNSFITIDGGEMGRAQVVQAEAARVEPSVLMNPVLLKPTSDVGSQVIVLGKVMGNKRVPEYYAIKKQLKQTVHETYNQLSEQCEVIVMEGAGSIAEINLKENDFVNMGMAEMVNAPVILIADIDRGGVFASVLGTILLLEESERKRVKGFIINKFRGNKELLMPGMKMLEDKVDIPCLGIIPYFETKIDDEDSVSERFSSKSEGDVNIGIIKLPYISNYTDFTPFESINEVGLSYIDPNDSIDHIDLLIIPGSKNVIGDMTYLRETGLDKKIITCYKKKIPIIGICGGYQILGNKILDPHRIETNNEIIDGLGVLDIETTFLKDKTTRQTIATFTDNIKIFGDLKGCKISGYEIHLGKTMSNEKQTLIFDNGQTDGVIDKTGLVFATYLHGIFDNKELLNNLISYLKNEKGMDHKTNIIDYKALKEKEYQKLATIVKENVDFDEIKKIIGLD